MTKIKVVMVGMPQGFADAVQDELRTLGLEAEVLGDTDMLQTDPNCECDICQMDREAAGQGRSPLTHPSIKISEDGKQIMDIVRHRLFSDGAGHTVFFEVLFHPMDELNLYTCECEREAEKIFQAIPLFNDDGSARFLVVDHRSRDGADLLHIRGTVQAADGRQAEIMCIAGPNFEKAKRLRMAQAH